MYKWKFAVLDCMLILVLVIPALAQKNELALTGGGQFSTNSLFNSQTSWVVGASYGGRIFHLPAISLYVEFPVTVAPENTLSFPSPTNYSSLFITPGLKLKFVPGFPISPYVTAGFGYARFHNNATATVPSQTTNTTVFDFGGGVDLKIFPYLSLRGEMRDYYAGVPEFGVINNLAGRQHNVVPQGGLVFRF